MHNIFLYLMAAMTLALTVIAIRIFWHACVPGRNVSKQFYKPTGFVYYLEVPKSEVETQEQKRGWIAKHHPGMSQEQINEILSELESQTNDL